MFGRNQLTVLCFVSQQKPLQPEMGYNSLANYYIEKKIGRGQFSEVYRAKYLIDNTPVALKKIQVSLSKLLQIYRTVTEKKARNAGISLRAVSLQFPFHRDDGRPWAQSERREDTLCLEAGDPESGVLYESPTSTTPNTFWEHQLASQTSLPDIGAWSC